MSAAASSSRSSSRVPSPTEATQTILKGRKCYRVSKDKNEVVWPPHLEAALMEGLDEYKPAESKSPRGLTRFPNRNKFISEYIYKKTGETRTAKQVGSRIQQLRDTAAGKTIMKAISDKHYEMMHPTPPTPSAHELLGMGVAGMPGMFGADDMLYASVPMHVYISVPPSPPSPHLSSQDAWRGSPRYAPTDVNVLSGGAAYQWMEPRALRGIDPTVTFKSSMATPLWSTCRVLFHGETLHEDQPVIMGLKENSALDGAYLHFTSLSPGYWTALCAAPDLAPYTIVQEISKQTDDTQDTIAVMRIVYHFTAGPAPPLSPFNFSDHALDDIEYDSTEDILAMSTSSSSPYVSDRSSSPSYSNPHGFGSAPMSPVDWAQHQQHQQAAAAAAAQWAFTGQNLPPSFTSSSQTAQFSGSSGYYGQPSHPPSRFPGQAPY